jgi:hypothetical protein
LWVIAADDFTYRLVVRQHPNRHGLYAHRQRPAIDLDAVAKLYALAYMGQLIIHGDAAFANEALHL